MPDLTTMSVEELCERYAELWTDDGAFRKPIIAELTSRTEVGKSRWVKIRRVGGENDSLAKVELIYELDEASAVIATELLASNFAHEVNLSLVEQNMNKHKPLNLPMDRTKQIRAAIEADDGLCSTCSPAIASEKGVEQ